MKKIFSFLLSGVLSLFIYASGITIGGKTYAVDTIVHSHDIGPGTKYAFYDIPAYPCHGSGPYQPIRRHRDLP